MCTFEIEAENDEEAREMFNQGLWDHTDLIHEETYELGKFNDSNEYVVIEENEI